MIKNVRPSCWETNSSSDHVLFIGNPVQDPTKFHIPEKITLDTGEYERGEYYLLTTEEKACYLFSYFLSAHTEEDWKRLVDRLVKFLQDNGVEVIIADPGNHSRWDFPGYGGYVGGVLNDEGSLKSDILWWYDDDDKLKRFLFLEDGYVAIHDQDND